jgi:hypothetical protein
MTFLTYLLAFLSLAALGIYIFGIPPELKRKLEKQALKTMGENKMSYVVKGELQPPNYIFPIVHMPGRTGGETSFVVCTFC